MIDLLGKLVCLINWLGKLVVKVGCFLQWIDRGLGLYVCLFGGEDVFVMCSI